MALSAAAVAKAAAAVLSDEKGRNAILSVIVGVLAVILIPFFLVITLLTMPTNDLLSLVTGDEAGIISQLRGQYGLDQHIGDEDYLLGEGLDFSELSFTDGQTEVKYYSQLDSRWKDTPYGDGTIGRSGCGPTSLSIVVSSLTDSAVDPVQMSRWADENGYKAPGNGSYHSLIRDGARHFGINVSGISTSEPYWCLSAPE